MLEWLGARVGAGEECVFTGEVSALVEKLAEYEHTLELMNQHTGVLYLRETLREGSEVS